MSVSLSGSGGARLSLSVPASTARDLLAGLLGEELTCEGDRGSTRDSVLLQLDHGGPRARVSRRVDDGVLVARRSGQRFRLDLRQDDGGRVVADLPWALADCLLGRRTDLDRLLAGGTVRLRQPGGDWLELELR
jgi:hypothetical protein